MQKSLKRKLPNIDVGAYSKPKVAKIPYRTHSLNRTNSKLGQTSKFPLLSKDSFRTILQTTIHKQSVQFSDYFFNIPSSYPTEASMMKLFADFKILYERAMKYYSNYRLHQLHLLTKKNQHIHLPEVDKQNSKILLLLDLDETLIHSDSKRNSNNDVRIEFMSTLVGQVNQKNTVFISIRPHLQQFLEKLSNCGIFEVGVFTAGSKGYAEGIINHLDPEGKFIQHRIFRDNCVQLPECIFAKDLRIFKNRSLDRILLVDNSPFCFANKRNAIPILSYEGNQNDRQLLQLFDYLVSLTSRSDNIVQRNHEHFMQLL